jgi:RNA recognition motif-containing protein
VTCFVKGFDNSMGEDDVREALTAAFAPYGEVADIRLPFDRFNQCLKGFGYVVFAEANGATVRAALRMLWRKGSRALRELDGSRNRRFRPSVACTEE